MAMLTRIPRSILVLPAILLPWVTWTWCAPQTKTDDGGPWGKPVDGLVCRLTVQPRYAVGQAISAVIEVKNVSDKKRFIIRHLHLGASQYLPVTIEGPQGKVPQSTYIEYGGVGEASFQAIAPGEIKRVEIPDLRACFYSLDPFSLAASDNPVPTGKFTVRLRFRSPPVPKQFTGFQVIGSDKETPRTEPKRMDAPAELLANHWA